MSRVVGEAAPREQPEAGLGQRADRRAGPLIDPRTLRPGADRDRRPGLGRQGCDGGVDADFAVDDRVAAGMDALVGRHGQHVGHSAVLEQPAQGADLANKLEPANRDNYSNGVRKGHLP